MVMFIPANLYPMMTFYTLGKPDASTILEGIAIFIQYGMYPVALIIFIASFVVPIGKIIGLFVLMYHAKYSSKLNMKQQSKLYHLVEFLGPWSMLDVFVVVIMAAVVNLGFLTSIEPAAGITYFALMVVFTMIAAESFDARLLWTTNIRMRNKMDKNDHPELVVEQKKGISAVWIVPLVALLFGAWLVVKAVAERGIFITVQFDSANGIVVGKTEVRYKGLTIGKVSNIDVNDDLQSVLVEIEMIAESKPALTDKASFWYVTADVSFAGVKGLDTLLSGSYINMRPDFNGDGEAQRHFIALDEEPPLSEDVDGLHLVLTADELGSIS